MTAGSRHLLTVEPLHGARLALATAARAVANRDLDAAEIFVGLAAEFLAKAAAERGIDG